MIAKLFSFKGGVKPASHKDESATAPIRVAPLPSRLIIPLRQSARAMARCLVQPGQAVLKGEVIAADRKSTRLNSSHSLPSRMPSSA